MLRNMNFKSGRPFRFLKDSRFGAAVHVRLYNQGKRNKRRRVMAVAGDGVLFSERQRFLQTWVWALVMVVVIGVWAMALMQFVFDRPEDPSLANDIIVIVAWALAGVGIPVLFLVMRLETEVRGDGLYVRFFPFHLNPRKFAWADIAESRARRYDALREYGGWGIRWGKGGRAYNISGDRGLQLVLKDGKRWLIGSQKADELAAAAELAMTPQTGKGIRP
jgi:hypothetical protein